MRKSPSIYALPILLILAIGSSWAIINQNWQGAFWDLFLPVQQLLDKVTTGAIDLPAFAKALSLLPTMATAIMAGGLLGMASVLLQVLAKNTLASDSTLAVGGGAQMALLLATLFLPSFGAFGSFWVGLVGALSSMGLVFLLSAPSRMNPVVMILAGLVINILLGATANVLLLFYSQYSLGVLVWGSGVLTQSGWTVGILLFATLMVFVLAIIPLYRALVVMGLDEQQARSLGVPVTKIRLYLTVIVASVLSMIVSNLGIIGFVGLGAATLVNALSIHKLHQRLVMSFIFGALILWTTSNLTTLFLAGTGVGAGSMTAILGTPLIIYLLLTLPKQKDNSMALSAPFNKTFHPSWAMVVLAVLIIVALHFAPLIFGQGNDTVIAWAWAGLDKQWLIVEYRLPRTLTAVSAGIMLAVAGVVLQNLSKNPMASPEVLGISSATAMGVIVGFFVLPMMGLSPSLTTLFGFGMLGAVLSLLLIVWLSKKVASGSLLLVGIAISALVGAVMSIIKVSGNPQLTAVLSFLSGSSYYANPLTSVFYFIIALLGTGWAWVYAKPLSLIGFGDTVAKGRGVNVTKTHLVLLTLVAILSVTATFATGPLSFVGLMIPHLALMLGARTLQSRIIASAILGACLLVVSDWIGRYVIFPYEIPAGSIASLMGGAYFVYLMRKLR